LALLARIRARLVMVSYSTDGIMPVQRLLEALAKRGDLRVLTQPYRRYRVSSQRPSPRPHTVEFVAVVDGDAPPQARAVEQAVEAISHASAATRVDGTSFRPAMSRRRL
jgi:adenine-specific DNA-methyltransferase